MVFYKFMCLSCSYNQVSFHIEDYDKAQNALKTLKKGTDEWREAMEKNNDIVMDLITKYP